MQIELTDLPMPLVIRPAEPLSDEQLIKLSRRSKPYRLERTPGGEIVIMTPVTGRGSQHEIFVASMLYAWTELDARGIAFSSNAGFNLQDGSCLSPDAAWILRERWDNLTEDQQDSFLPFCPDFLIEIRSKSDRRRPLEEKMQSWMENGATLAWLIDPIDANVTIYRAGGQPETLVRPDRVAAGEPVLGFVLNTARLWKKL